MPTPNFTTSNDSYDVTVADTYILNFLAGDDTLTMRSAGATAIADMGDGNDLVSHRAGTASVQGGTGADRYDVFASGLTAYGGADADLFNVRGGTGLILNGEIGNDRFNFYAGSASILLHGNDGTDDFFGYNQTISGDIYGDAGNDYFIQFRTGVTLHGGAGNDIFRVTVGAPAAIVENAGEGTDSVQVARGYSYTLGDNVENISVQGSLARRSARRR